MIVCLGIKPVLSHGDYWSKNIIFKRDNKGRASSRVHSILDWQNSHVGTGINDIARFILTSCSAQVQQISFFLYLLYSLFVILIILTCLNVHKSISQALF